MPGWEQARARAVAPKQKRVPPRPRRRGSAAVPADWLKRKPTRRTPADDENIYMRHVMHLDRQYTPAQRAAQRQINIQNAQMDARRRFGPVFEDDPSIPRSLPNGARLRATHGAAGRLSATYSDGTRLSVQQLKAIRNKRYQWGH